MKTKTLLVIAPLALGALSACQSEMDRQRPLTKAPAATVVGPAEDCIPLASLSSSRVHDDYTIDFKVGSRTYRNTLPNKCPSLGFEKAFTYSTSLTRLCSTDIIYVLRQGAGQLDRGAGCGLGRFVPVELTTDKPEG